MQVVKNNDVTIHYLGGACRLLPGTNEVDDLAWADAKKLAVVKHHIEAGLFEEVRTVEGQVGDVSAIDGLSTKDAVKIVEETFDAALLDQWKLDKRRAVRQAAEKQIAAIDARLKGNGDSAAKVEGGE